MSWLADIPFCSVSTLVFWCPDAIFSHLWRGERGERESERLTAVRKKGKRNSGEPLAFSFSEGKREWRKELEAKRCDENFMLALHTQEGVESLSMFLQR